MVEVNIQEDVADLAVALVEATGVHIAPSDDELRRACEEAAATVVAEGPAGGDARRQAVRDLLRRGGYKPSGRSKPAQEYLLRTVREQEALPAISNVVDLINLVSLKSGLPISLVAVDRPDRRLLLRYGRAGESYVFNRSGQALDLGGLLCLCAVDGSESQPIGSPVKDSMRGKVDAADRHVLGCIFASRPAIAPAELHRWAEELGRGFSRFCSAAEVAIRIDTGSGGAIR
jgi:DNA/RNA-binding domain of Phe-tRNA-synthetase-like protein